MPGGDTIGMAHREYPTLPKTLWDFALRAICARWGHRWQPYSGALPYGKREYCGRCLSNRITFPDGEVVLATAVQIRAGDTRFAEAVYEARWGEPPRRKLRPGEWPLP